MTLSLDFLHQTVTPLFSPLWIDSPNRPTFFRCLNCRQLRKRLNLCCTMFSVCMASPVTLSLTGGNNSPFSFGRSSAVCWGPRSAYPLGSIPNLMSRPSRWIKRWRLLYGALPPTILPPGPSSSCGWKTPTTRFPVRLLDSHLSSAPEVTSPHFFLSRSKKSVSHLSRCLSGAVVPPGCRPALHSCVLRTGNASQRPTTLLARRFGCPLVTSHSGWSPGSWLHGLWVLFPSPGSLPLLQSVSAFPQSMRVHPAFHVSKLKPVKESQLQPSSRPPPPPGSLTRLLLTLLIISLSPNGGEEASSIWWTGRVMDLKSTPGSCLAVSLTQTSSRISIGSILTSLVGHQEPSLEGGVLSQLESAHNSVIFCYRIFHVLTLMSFQNSATPPALHHLFPRIPLPAPPPDSPALYHMVISIQTLCCDTHI